MSGERRVTPTGSVAVLRAGLALSGLDVHELWIAYLGLGGSMTPEELNRALQGDGELLDHEHDLIAQALNDHFVASGQNHPVAYANELHEQVEGGS
jgi:hypothetical protein